jgi:hypothetical protein
MLLGRKIPNSSSTVQQSPISLSSGDERGAPIASRFLSSRLGSTAPPTEQSTKTPPAPPFHSTDPTNGHHSRDRTDNGGSKGDRSFLDLREQAQAYQQFADLDSIAETHSSRAIANNNTISISQQIINSASLTNNNPLPSTPAAAAAAPVPDSVPQAPTSEREVDEDFDPALLAVLSAGESDVHSLLSVPGDLPSHRDPLASLGLTPLSLIPTAGGARRDKAAQILGIPHRKSMEPVPSPNAPHGGGAGGASGNRGGRFSSFGSRATGGYTNTHATIPEGQQGHGNDLDIITDYRTSHQGRHRAMSGATTNTQLGARHGLGVGSAAGRDGPLTSLYLVAGLPKSHHAWTLADPDSVLGLQHSDGAVGRWWRPEVLGSTVSPGVTAKEKDGGAGAGGVGTPVANANATTVGKSTGASSAASLDGRKRRKSSNATIPSNHPGGSGAGGGSAGAGGGTGAVNMRDPGAAIGMSKSQVAKMLSKALKLSFTREVEIIASTLQPASTVHSFTFSLPTPAGEGIGGMGMDGGAGMGMGGIGGERSAVDVRSSVYSGRGGLGNMSGVLGGGASGGMGMLASARPSSTYLGPTTTPLTPAAQEAMQAKAASSTTFYGVCLTVHAPESSWCCYRCSSECQRWWCQWTEQPLSECGCRTGDTDFESGCSCVEWD